MLEKIRERSKGALAWVFASIISIAFIFLGLGTYAYMAVGKINDKAAVVDGSKDIYISEVLSLAKLYSRSYGQTSDDSYKKGSDFYKLALDRIVMQRIAGTVIEKLGTKIDDERIQDTILEIPEFRQDNKFSSKKYHETLYTNSLNDASFRKDLGHKLAANQVFNGIAKTVILPKKELELAAVAQKQSRDIKYFLLNLNSYKGQAVVTQTEIEDYYKEYSERFVTKPLVSVEYVMLSINDLISSVTVDEGEIDSYYEMNKDTFSKEKGDKVIFESKEKVRDKIIDSIKYEKAEEKWSNLCEDLANLSFENPDSLDFAKELGLSTKVSREFTSDLSGSGVAANAQFVKAAFSSSTLDEKINSELINYDNDTAVVLRLHKYTPSRQQELKEVEGNIKAILVREKASELMYKDGQRLSNEINNGVTFDELAKSIGAEIKYKQKIFFDSVEIEYALKEAIYSLPSPDLKSSKKATAVNLNSNKVAVVTLDKVNKGNLESLGKNDLIDYREKLNKALGGFEYYLVMDSLNSKVNVSYI